MEIQWKYNIVQTCPNQSFFDLVNLEARAVFEQSSRQRSDWQRILGEVVWAKVQAPGRKTNMKLCKPYLDYAGHIQCMTQLYHTVSVPVLSCVVCIIVIWGSTRIYNGTLQTLYKYEYPVRKRTPMDYTMSNRCVIKPHIGAGNQGQLPWSAGL